MKTCWQPLLQKLTAALRDRLDLVLAIMALRHQLTVLDSGVAAGMQGNNRISMHPHYRRKVVMKSIYRFNIQYNVDRLVTDLRKAEQAGQYYMHWDTKNYDGNWEGISLVSPDGKTDATSLRNSGGKYRKTEILKQCPYFEEIIDSFHCPTRRVRLLRLEAGAKILKHRDPLETWAMGEARLHIPIITHEEIYFYVDGQRVIMRPGELWYCNFSRPHWVENRSPIDRVHMVLDLIENDWLRQMFPRESIAERVGNRAYRYRLRGVTMLRRRIGGLRRKIGRLGRS